MKKPGRTYVLEQDEHLQNLRKIIKRDFFNSQNQKQKSDTIQLSLNDYITNFKSNQNKIFSELVEQNKQKWNKEHWWFQKQDKLLMLERQKLQKAKLQNKQYQNMIKQIEPDSHLLAITNQQAKNSIFFNRDKNFGSYLAEDAQKAKKIHYNNCRITSEEEKQKNKNKQQKSDEQEGIQNPITWGQIQATPLRIRGQEQYKIPQRPPKDLLLDKLNKKIYKQKIQAQNNNSKKSQLIIKIMGSSTPAYKNSSFIRNSSIRRVSVPSTPINIDKKQKKQEAQMKGLLNLNKE